jgi:hypothetical protein
MSMHPLYNTWHGILKRCENPHDPEYHLYGGRGITVCDRWHDVRLFVIDIERELGPRPVGMSLDRKDNDGNYELSNVQWADAVQQQHNRDRIRPRPVRSFRDHPEAGTFGRLWREHQSSERTLAETIDELRAKGFTFADLAAEIGASRQAISQWRKRRSVNVVFTD